MGWRTAMRMRFGFTFAEATQQIMADTAALQDALAAPPKTPPARLRRDTPPKRPTKRWRQNQQWEDDDDQSAKGNPRTPGRPGRARTSSLSGRCAATGATKTTTTTSTGPGSGRRAAGTTRYPPPGGVGGTRPSEVPPLTPRPVAGADLIALSAFDGIGAAPWLIAELAGRPMLAVTWEIDPACITVAERRMPTGRSVRRLRRDLIETADPQAQATVIWSAAPPCQDFSRLRAAGPGHEGERGGLFLWTVEFQKALFKQLGTRRMAFLYENVVMTKANADIITEALGHAPVFACGGDFGWITRPRLWWTSVKWDQVTHDIVDGRRLQWAMHAGTGAWPEDSWPSLAHPNTTVASTGAAVPSTPAVASRHGAHPARGTGRDPAHGRRRRR